MADAPTRFPISRPLTEAPPQPPAPEVRARFGAKEIITLEVNGRLFTNWTNVRVEQNVTQWFPTFQFECTEEAPVPIRIDAAQFVPGDAVQVYVGGVPAVNGYISERHVGYDAKNHGVKLVGMGKTSDLTNSCVPLEKLDGHDGKSWTQLATDLSAHLDIKVKQVGAVDNAPFANIQIQPGETVQAALERYARMRNIVIGCDPFGNLLAIGENQSVSTGDLVEGGNILKANCVLRDPMLFKKIFAIGQGFGSDDANGDPQNKQVAFLPGTSTRNRYMVAMADVADTLHGIQRRAKMEQLFTDGSQLEAQITVQGWFKDYNQSNSVWRAGEYYAVNSPSLMLDGVILGCSSCVYEQNDGGSTTTLTMVDPLHINGQFNFRDGEQFVQAAKAAAAAAPGPEQTQPM